MVNNIKKIGVVLVVLFLCSCKKEKEVVHKNENPKTLTLKQELYSKINSFIDSSNCKEKEVISIRYQMYDKKKFIQISAQSVFITDSLYSLKENRNHLLAFYNKEFFNSIIENNEKENKNIIEKNHQWDLYKNSYTKTGMPCFDMYELINKKLVQVPKNSYYYNNLFANPPMSELPPPPAK